MPTARLRDYQVSLPVLGDEDVQSFLVDGRNLVTQLDNLESRAQAMRTTLMMAVRVPEELISILTSFGVEVYEEAPQSLEEPAAIEQAPAEGEGAAS